MSSSSNCSDETSKEDIIKTSDEDETQVDISRSRQVESGRNQDQATDQEELNPQDDDVIGRKPQRTILHLAFLPQLCHQSLNQILQPHQLLENRNSNIF